MLNNFFNNFPGDFITSEQLLVEDLVIEAIQMYGMDLFYLPRESRDEFDMLYGEDVLKTYTKAYPIEMYIENFTGMEGEGDFISKFGLEIREEIRMIVSRRRFKATIPDLIRPNEGDLIYIPIFTSFFEIIGVENQNDQAMFYTLGRGRGGNVYLYALQLKQYVFSNEVIATDNTEINNSFRNYWPKVRLTIANTTTQFLNDEIIYQGNSIANATAQAYLFDFVSNTTIDVYRTQGTFSSANGIIRGSTSNATANIVSSSDTVLMSTFSEDIQDNQRLSDEVDSILNFSENNPFGS